MSAWLNRRGATLPLTLLVIALLGVSVAIAYSRLSSERRITGDAQAQVNALAVAQSGLSRYFATTTTIPGATANVTYNDLPGGTAQVNLVRIRDSVVTTELWPAIYVVTSRGTNTTAKRYSGNAAPAERTVATYAVWTPTPIDINAGVTSIVGMTANGNSGAYSGIDRCGGAASIPGVATPDGLWNANHPNIVDGNPDNAPVGLGTPGPAGTAKDSVDIDWASIVAGTALPADYVYPASGWPASFDDWPVVRNNGDMVMPGSGKGILIVTGDLTWNGTPNKQWEGLILVGGTLIGNGASDIYGAVVTGLNVKLGVAVPNYDVGNGVKTWQYDSCSLARALGHVGSLQRVRNAWTDTWSSY